MDPDTLDDAARHKMTIGTILPRPIAWTTTQNQAGVVNVAPFSYFMGCHSYLPALALSVGSRRDVPGMPKDTAANILSTGEFVVNLVDEALAEAMNQSAAAFPPDVGEAEAVGIELAPSVKVDVARVAASPISIECRLLHSLTLGEAPLASTLIVGRIVMWHVRADLLDPAYRIDQAAVQPIARMGGPNYVHARDPWTMAIPDWRDVVDRGPSDADTSDT